LIALVPPTGLLAFLAYYHAHEVNIRVGLLIIPGIVAGGWIGGKLANSLGQKKMRVTFAFLLFLLGAWQIVWAWVK